MVQPVHREDYRRIFPLTLSKEAVVVVAGSPANAIGQSLVRVHTLAEVGGYPDDDASDNARQDAP